MENMKLTANIILAAAILAAAAPARAAGPRDGLATASAEASSRLPGAVLTEIEGFADPEGAIPCAGKSFSAAWHYKFYSSATREWLLVNACAGSFINAAKEVPSMYSDEPTSRLPAAFADPAEVLEKLDKAKAFHAAPSSLSRDLLMNIRVLPKKDARPAGCYWTVSQGKAKAVIDCEGKKVWTSEGFVDPVKEAEKKARAKDTALKYLSLALAAVPGKYPGAALMAVGTMTDRDGNSKCVSDMDGWGYTFKETGPHLVAFGGCRGKTSLDEMVFQEGDNSLRGLMPLPERFKDSDYTIAKIPKDSRLKYSTFSMTLHKFKPGMSPVKGHSFIWQVECGTLRYYVDAYTGLYLGGGEMQK